MSSGFGFSGGTGRCFAVWQSFMDCYTAQGTKHPVECTPQADDYFECLHRPKERARVSTIRAQYEKNMREEGTPSANPGGVALKRSIPDVLGLVDK